MGDSMHDLQNEMVYRTMRIERTGRTALLIEVDISSESFSA